MRSRHVLCRGLLATVLCFVCLSELSTAEAEDRSPVFGVLTITSLNNVQDDLHYIFESAGIPEKARTVEAVVNLMTAGFGAAGIDPAKPLGCAMLAPQAGDLVFGFVPIADEEQFLKLVRVYLPDIRVTRAGGKEEPPTDELVVHFEQGHAFIYYSNAVPVQFPSPADFIPERAKLFDLSVSVQVDQYRDELLETFEAIHADLGRRILDLPKLPDQKLPRQIIQQTTNLFAGFRISRKDRNNVLELTLSPPTGKAFEQFSPNSNMNVRFSTDAYLDDFLDLVRDAPEVQALVKKSAQRDNKVWFQILSAREKVRVRLTIEEAYQRIVAHAYGASYSQLQSMTMPSSSMLVGLGYLIGGPPSITPEFDKATHFSLKHSPQKILLICQAEPAVAKLHADLAASLQKAVQIRFQTHEIQTSTLSETNAPVAVVTSAKELVALGKAEQTNYVISLRIKKYSLMEEDATDLYRLRSTVDVEVLRVGDGKAIFKHELKVVYSLRQPASTENIPRDRFKNLSMSFLSEKVGQLFYERYAGSDIPNGVLN